MTGLLFLLKGERQKESKGHRLMYGFAFFFFFFGTRNIFIFLSEFHYMGVLLQGAFFGEYDQYEPIYELYISLAHTFSVLSFTSLLFGIEIYFKKTKYILSIAEASFLIFIFVLPFSDEVNFMFLPVSYTSIVFMIVILYFIKKSPNDLKSIAFFIYGSGTLITLGMILTNPLFKSLDIVPIFTGSIIFIIACLLCIFPLIVDPKLLAQSMSYYISSVVILALAMALLLPIILFSSLPISNKIFTIITNSVSLIVIFRSYSLIKSVFKATLEEDKALSIFIRPQKVTEEEVSISKEKKICLVCKGLLGRILFMCPKCNSFYCIKCAEALTNLENVCWACNEPLDPSKTFTPFVIESKDKDLNIQVHKKRNGK